METAFIFFSDELTVGITDNMIQFIRAFLGYLEDVLRLLWPETSNLIDESLTSIISAQLKHCKTSLEDSLFANEVTFSSFFDYLNIYI